MDAFDGAGGGQRVGNVSVAGLGSGKDEGGAHSFAAGEERVTHRSMNRGGLGGRLRQEAVERAVDGGGARVEVAREVEGVGVPAHFVNPAIVGDASGEAQAIVFLLRSGG